MTSDAPLALVTLLLAGAASAQLADIDCRLGSVLREQEPEFWCERSGGLRHRPMWATHPDGSLATHSTAVLGRLQGPWRSWYTALAATPLAQRTARSGSR